MTRPVGVQHEQWGDSAFNVLLEDKLNTLLARTGEATGPMSGTTMMMAEKMSIMPPTMINMALNHSMDSAALDRLPRGSGVVIAGINPTYQGQLRDAVRKADKSAACFGSTWSRGACAAA